MGALLKLPPIEQHLKIEPPAKLLTLRKRSRILAAMFNGLFWFCAAFDLWAAWVALFYHGHNVAFGPEGGLMNSRPIENLPPGYVYWDDVTLPYRLGAVFALVTQFVPATMILFHLRGLFRLYAQGIVFAEENAKAFKLMAIWLIVYAATPCLSVNLLILLDLAIDKAWFHNTELYALGLGSILFVIAEVMRTAREIEQERDEFV